MKIDFTALMRDIKQNLKPGITVAFVSIPLSIAISIASGSGPVPGIITGFWATMIAAIFGGSRYNVVGPAGALTSILFAATASSIVGLQGPVVLPFIALFTGLIIFIVYLLKGERYIRYIPNSVVHGFAAGVAITIASSQLREAFGVAGLFKASGEFIHDMENIIRFLPNTNLHTFSVFLSFFVFLLIWKKYNKSIPGVIPATILGVAFGYVSKSYGILTDVSTIFDKYGNLSLKLIQVPQFELLQTIISNPATLVSILKVSFVVAVIAILETLITAKMADVITDTKFDQKKEVKGLSLANIFSGLMGGLPATGVFIRTGLNIKSGATTSHSSLIAGALTGIGAIFLMPVFKYVPMAVISAMLMMTAIGLIDMKHIKHSWKLSKTDFYLTILTALLVIVFDPGIAVLVGTVAALFIILEKTTTGVSEVSLFNTSELTKRFVLKKNSPEILEVKEMANSTGSVVYSLSGFLSYLDSHLHIENIEHIFSSEKNTETKLVLRLRNLDYADLESIESLAKSCHKLENKNGVQVVLSSIHDNLVQDFSKVEYFKKMITSGKSFKDTTSALSH